MGKVKKIAIVIATIFLLILTLNFALNYWVNKALPKIIADSNPTAYAFTYKDLDIDLLSKNIKASQLTVSPKSKSKDSLKKIGIYAKIESIEIIEFKFWNLIFNNRIKANRIKINKPEVYLYKNTPNAINNSRSVGRDVVKPFQEMILVENISLNDGTLKIIHNQKNEAILDLNNLNLQIDGIVITDEILKSKIPFEYSNYEFKADNIYYRISDVYHIRAKQLLANTKNVTIKEFKLDPEYSRKEFVRKLDKEKDLFTLKSTRIQVSNLNWGYQGETMFFNANSILLDQLSANIYRNKLPADDISKKPLYSKLLRDLKFPLSVDTLAIRNSILVYEEELSFEKGPGILKFKDFNLTATNINSGYHLKKNGNVNIDIDCHFMKDSPFKLNWSFDVLDKKDNFTMRGVVSNLDIVDLQRFTRPYLNASTEGKFEQLKFTIKGNDYNSYENASLKYHDLKVTLYKKGKPEKKNKIKSALANLILKNDSNGETKTTKVTVERIPEKSFFNFLWLNIAAVLKDILV